MPTPRPKARNVTPTPPKTSARTRKLTLRAVGSTVSKMATSPGGIAGHQANAGPTKPRVSVPNSRQKKGAAATKMRSNPAENSTYLMRVRTKTAESIAAWIC